LTSFEENDFEFCAIATDGSSHDALRLFPVLVQKFDSKDGGIQSKMIKFTNKPNETADTIAEYVQDTSEQRFLTFFSAPHLVTSKQSSNPYHWLTPLSKRIPFTFARHICDFPQHSLKSLSAPPGGASTLG